YGDKAAEAVLSHFRDEDRRREFWEYYRELQALYEILSPAPWLRAYVEDYRDLSAMYQLTRSAYSRTVAVDRTFLRKTEALVREHTITSAIQEPAPEVDLSPEAVRQLALEETSDTVKVFNLTKALQAAVERSLDDAPHLIAIGERAEEIARRFEQRLIEAGQAVAELRKLVLEYEQALASRSSSDLSREGFGVFWLLQNEQVNDADAIARAVEPTFAKYPHWRREQQQRAEVRTALYKPLLRSLKLDRAYALVDRILEVLGKADA
ncbi:MAG: type I restriction endonuclease subunit R, partial [Chloroflexi bacterium]|nr:type I restriction endonuclease subunit R [Chloroflexota bacterium]